MAKRSKNQNTYSHGDWNVICDVCGFKYKASDIKKRWDNLYVCADDWEPRHPMDFQKGFEDDPSVPFTRPETYTSVATTYGDGDVTIAWEQDNSNIHEWDEELSEDATVTIDPPLITSEQIITIRKTNTDNTVSPDVDICGSLLSRFTTVEKQRNFGTNIHLWSMDWSANGKHLYLGLGVHKQVQNYRSITNGWEIDEQTFLDSFTPESFTDTDGVRVTQDGTEVWITAHTGLGNGSTLSYSLPTPYIWEETGANQPVLIGSINNARAEFKHLNDLNINPEGTKLISYGNDSQQFPYQQDMTAWDVTTLAYGPDNKVITASNCFVPKDGTCMYISSGKVINKYSFGTAWDLASLGSTVVDSIDITSDLSANIQAMFITDTRLFVVDDDDIIYQYNGTIDPGDLIIKDSSGTILKTIPWDKDAVSVVQWNGTTWIEISYTITGL